MAGERFLVTGCAGFIGGHMLDMLVKRGCEVTGVDDFSTGNRSNLASALPHIRFIEGDLSDPAVAEDAVAGVQYVVHLASIPSVPRSLANPVASAQSSVMSTVSLLEAARKAGVRRVVQSSSSSVYGDAGSDGPKVESFAPNPLTPYAVAKLAQEYYARVFALCHELDTISLRYFNVFGPRQNPNGQYAAVIPKFITEMLAGRRPVIFGDGSQTRDFTYVDNVVEANYRAALSGGHFRGISANAAGGGSVSLNDLVRMLNELLGTDLPPVHADRRPGDILHSFADSWLAGSLFGYETHVRLTEGLRRTVESIRNLP